MYDALPPDERKKVVDCLKSAGYDMTVGSVPAEPPRDMQAIIEQVFDEHDELFQKLAQYESRTCS
jgi:hypothetical protein